jgi:hypothetical protein
MQVVDPLPISMTIGSLINVRRSEEKRCKRGVSEMFRVAAG